MREFVKVSASRLATALVFTFAVSVLSFMPVFAASEAYAAGTTLYSWGVNANGQLGLGHQENRNTPQRVGEADNWVSVSSAIGGTVAINTEGHLYGWGAAWNAAQMGQGANPSPGTGLILEPTRIGTADNWVEVHISGTHFSALNDQGQIYNWGVNGIGQLGQGHLANINVPTRLGDRSNWVQLNNNPLAGIAINDLGHLYTWGNNGGGVLGIGTEGGNYEPQRVGTESNWAYVMGVGGGEGSNFLAINDQGELFGWGAGQQNLHGQGAGISAVSVPTQIGTASNWTAMAGGNFAAYALNSNGELYSWGGTGAGNLATLGRPVTAANPADVPTRIEGRNDWMAIGGGAQHGMAITAGLEVYVWGLNASGQLGLGDPNTSRFEPTFLLQSYGFAGFSQSGAGHMSMALIRTEPIPLPLTKVLQMPQGTDIPGDPTFEFYFTPATIAGSSSFPGPAVTGNPLEVGLSSITTTTTAGTTTVTGEIDLWNILNNLTFPHAGIFVWEVHEVAQSSSVNAGGTGHTMTYSTARFQIQAEVDVTNNIREMYVFPMTYSEGTWTAGTAKQGYMEFVNTLIYIPLEDTPANLTVSKTITGELANLTQLFDFTLTLTPHVLAPLPDNISVRIVGPGNTVVDRAITRTGNVFTFSLTNQETFEITNLPAGTAFAVTEAAAQSFLPSVRAYAGGELIHSATGTVNTALTANHADQRVAETGRNAADFTNAHQHVPVTGLTIAGISVFVIAALVIFGIVALMASRRRRAIEAIQIH